MENESKKRTRQKHGDRITLSPGAVSKLKEFDSQIESVFGQTVAVSHKDKIAFLLECRGSHFNVDELAQIHVQYFDEVKAVQLALNELKAARASGDRDKVAEVMKKLAAPHVIENDAPARPRVARAKRPRDPAVDSVGEVELSDSKT